MEYSQRDSGIFIRQNLIPQSDLQAERVYQGGQIIHPGIHQALVYPVGTGPLGQRLLQLDTQGRQVESLGYSKVLNIVAPRTDVASVNLPSFTMPEFTVALLAIRATAVSGTTPSLAISLQSLDSQGVFALQWGGIAPTALTAVSASSAAMNIALGTFNAVTGVTVRVIATITGTTPSFTWYADFIYK